MKEFIQCALLLGLAMPASLGQIYLRVNHAGVTTAINNGGSVTVNAPGPQQAVELSVSITYAGPGALRMTGSPRLGGSPDFSLGDPAPASTLLAPGQSVAIPLRFVPSSTRLTSSQVTWEFTETISQTQVSRTGAVVVGMNGTAPSLELGYSFPLNGNFNALPPREGTLPFPLTPVNGVSTAAVTLLNRGTGQAQIEAITVSGEGFTVAQLPVLPNFLNAGATTRFDVRYQPRTAGQQQGLLTVRYGGGQSMEVVLRGEGAPSYLRYEFEAGADSPKELLPNGLIEVAGTPIGQRTAVTVRFTNASPFDITVPSIGVNGEGWALTSAPFMPLTMAPDSTQYVTVTFAPTRPAVATGRLRIGNDSFELRGEAQGSQLQYRYSSEAGEIRVEPGTTITIPNGAIGETRMVTVTVINSGTTAAAINTIAIPSATPTGFSLSGLPPLPYTLGPGQSLQFQVQFKALGAGPSSGTLVLNSVLFGLLGTADPLPELPEVIFQGPATVQAFEQPRISVSLARPYPVALRGILSLAVESDGFAIDPTAQFSTGGRSVPFTIPAGSLRASFPTGLADIRFQTGSVAGTFVLNAVFATTTDVPIASDAVKPLRIALAAGAPRLLTGGVQSRGLTSLALEFIGVTTTRSLSRMTVKVKARSGYQIANTEYTQDLTGPSLLWFYSPVSAGYGGQFVATLPLQLSANGSITPGTDLVQAIESLTVTVQNDRGSSDPVTISIP